VDGPTRERASWGFFRARQSYRVGQTNLRAPLVTAFRHDGSSGHSEALDHADPPSLRLVASDPGPMFRHAYRLCLGGIGQPCGAWLKVRTRDARAARAGSVLRERSGIRGRIVIEERTRAVPKQHGCCEAEDHCQRRAHPLVMYGGEHGLRS
jgi:hypothetical protein